MDQHPVKNLPEVPRDLQVEVVAAGKPTTVTVSQLKIGEYRQAFRLLDEGDEVARLTLSTGRPVGFIESLDPASYEMLCAADLKVNAFFFSYASRQAQMRQFTRTGGILFPPLPSEPGSESATQNG